MTEQTTTLPRLTMGEPMSFARAYRAFVAAVSAGGSYVGAALEAAPCPGPTLEAVLEALRAAAAAAVARSDAEGATVGCNPVRLWADGIAWGMEYTSVAATRVTLGRAYNGGEICWTWVVQTWDDGFGGLTVAAPEYYRRLAGEAAAAATVSP
ncbi:MAG TPA: hypothetical protein DCQ64_15825 [Candidatus Rokubacteria bacterium]|nr:hypothetical protein [Candidatus Rokubacteria bacterium]